MTTLHLISQPAALQACRLRLGEGDAVLLMEAGVCVALSRNAAEFGPDVNCYVLQEHLDMMSVRSGLPDCGWVLVDFAGFVALTGRHQTIINWT